MTDDDIRASLARAEDTLRSEYTGKAHRDRIILLVAEVAARMGRIAVNKTEAAEMLGVSLEFFDEHIDPEIQSIRRGRRVIYPIWELWGWMAREAQDR